MKISIITVCFNSVDTIVDCIESVLGQINIDVEYIIIDGGSTDGTLGELEKYKDDLSFFVSEKDRGIYDAMNKGLKHATGDVIGILNSDDFYTNSSVLAEMGFEFFSNSNIDAVMGNIDFVESRNLLMPVRKYAVGNFRPWMFVFGLMPPHPAIFFRKRVYDEVGFYSLNYKIASDFDFLIRSLSVKKLKFIQVNKTLVRMRLGGLSTNGLRANVLSTIEMKRALKENGLLSSYIFLMLRLPYKFFTQIILK